MIKDVLEAGAMAGEYDVALLLCLTATATTTISRNQTKRGKPEDDEIVWELFSLEICIDFGRATRHFIWSSCSNCS
jgi:hypothetical protein